MTDDPPNELEAARRRRLDEAAADEGADDFVQMITEAHELAVADEVDVLDVARHLALLEGMAETFERHAEGIRHLPSADPEEVENLDVLAVELRDSSGVLRGRRLGLEPLLAGVDELLTRARRVFDEDSPQVALLVAARAAAYPPALLSAIEATFVLCDEDDIVRLFDLPEGS